MVKELHIYKELKKWTSQNVTETMFLGDVNAGIINKPQQKNCEVQCLIYFQFHQRVQFPHQKK